MAAPRDRPGRKPAATPWPERVAAAIGCLFVLGAFGILLYRELAGGDVPPRIELHVEAIQAQPSGGYLVLIRAANAGDRTAAQLRVSGELRQDGRTVEASDTSFDYLPGHSRRHGGLFFTRNPHDYSLALRATGYVEP